MSQLSLLVNKLGHELDEIRLRALCTIISKLDNGLITEAELIDKDNLFQNLIKWFQFKNVLAKEEVLNLIIRLIKCEGCDASVLLLKADPGLAQLRKITDCDVLVQDVINITSKQVNSARYTKSDRDYVFSEASKGIDTARTVESKASSNFASYRQSARSTKTVGSQSSCPRTLKPSITSWDIPGVEGLGNLPSGRTCKTSSLQLASQKESAVSSQDRVIWSLPRVPLVASDLHVISTVQDSLKNLVSVPQTCHFFTSVMLCDFPAQVFIQHPGVIWQLLALLKKPSPANTSAVECLNVYTQLLLDRLVFCSQLEFTSHKYQTYDSEEGSIAGDVAQQYQQEGYLSNSSDLQETTKASEPLTIPQYCLVTLNAVIQLVCRVQQATPLVLRVLKLFSAVTPDVRSIMTRPRLSGLLRGLLDNIVALIKQSVSYETIVELHVIAVSLRVVEALVPINLASAVLPTELQELLCFSLMDPMLVVHYPQLHNTALTFANVLKRKGTQVYHEMSGVMEAMKASVQFSREADSLPSLQALNLFRDSLPALPFHQNLAVIREFVQYVLERVDLSDSEVEEAASLIRSLLAHSEKSVASETYSVCCNVVTSLLGPRQALTDLDPGPRLLFLTHTSVLVEITCHGVTSNGNQIQQNAEDILTHLLKCQLLVSERSWHRMLEQLAPVLPLLQCHASKVSPLGRAVLHMLDPDIANCAVLSSLQVLTGNTRLLLHKDPVIREEAVSRLLWLTSMTDSPNKRLADICVLDVAVTGHTPVTGMYEASSVVRVLELLSAPCVEARVQQSAITQLSVMTEDSRLHQVFIDHRGIELFISILSHVLEGMNKDASYYIIPIIATMKHMARHNVSVRQNLSHHEPFLLCVLKSMFQLSEWRLQRDGTQLLTLLLYADFVLSSAASLSLPQLVVQSLHLPFPCQAHWTVSPNTTTSLRGVVLGEMGAERLLSVLWTVTTQGLDNLLQLSEVPSERTPLALSQRTVRQLQASHLPHNCRLALYAFQNATSHQAAIQALASLTSYLELSWLVDPELLVSLPWKNTFKRFLLIPPSGQDDFNLLHLVLKFLHFLLGVSPQQNKWISEALLTSPHTLLQLIMVANSASHDQDMWKKICLCTLAVCRRCLQQDGVHSEEWQVLVRLILQCLGHSHTQEYYSLALLDSKLNVLLTAVDHRQLADSAAILWQLLTAFHCESPHSFMGLSITRHTILCLNKMLTRTQEWERAWLCEENVRWVESVCASRDVVVRAAGLQLWSGLVRTPRGSATITELCPNLVESVMRMIVDHSEASVVREYAALLLTNILRHSSSKEFAEFSKTMNLFREFRDSVNLVACSPVLTHIDPSSGMLYTDCRFVRAGCWLISNLLMSSADETLQQISSSGLPTALCRTLMDVEKLECSAAVSMIAAVCRLLTLCCSYGCEIPQLYDCLPAVTALLDPDTIGYELGETAEEVQSLWQESLRLLTHVLRSGGGEAEFVLPSAAVSVLCQSVTATDPSCGTLRLTALQAVPTLCDCLTPGAEVSVCESMVAQWDSVKGKTKSALSAALTALLGPSSAATTMALQLGLLDSSMTRLRELHLTLTVQTTSTDRLSKKDPRMWELHQLLSLLTAIMRGSDDARREAANIGIADVIHKLWAWCHADDKYIIAVLECLVTFTASCPHAASTLMLTSTVLGTSQRKSPTAHSLVHAVIALVISGQQSAVVTAKALALLSHCCQAQDARCVIAKSALLTRWSDLWAERRHLAEETELLWLRFILVFTFFPEGQLSLPKTGDLFPQVIQCSENGRQSCKPLATAVLRNLAANSSNKPRFLSNKPLLQLLGEKLLSGGECEKRDAALITWSLAANSQKAKVALRNAGLAQRLRLASATSQDEVFSFVSDLLKPR